MPTAPDPNSPFMETRLAADFGREPGMPSSAGKPTVQPGGLDFPAPPAPAAGLVGRPPTAIPEPPSSAAPPAQIPGTDSTAAKPASAPK